MSAIRKELVRAAINRSFALMDNKIRVNLHKAHEFSQKTILAVIRSFFICDSILKKYVKLTCTVLCNFTDLTWISREYRLYNHMDFM